MRMPDLGRSFRGKLLLWLVPLTTVWLVVGATADYLASRNYASNVHDLELANGATVVGTWITQRGGVLSFAPPPNSDEILRHGHEHGQALEYRVYLPDGGLLASTSAAFVPDPRAVRRPGISAYDATQNGRNVRVVTVPVACGLLQCRVEVAEPAAGHDGIRHTIFLSTMLPELLLGLLILASIWFGISRAMRPIEKLSREMEDRPIDNFEPLEQRDVPREVLPLVEAMNRLLVRAAESARTLNNFTSDAAHQLRTPIAVIQARTELASAMPMSESARGHLREIHQATLRAARLSKQMLSLARITDDDTRSHGRTLVELRKVIEGIANECVHLALAKQIDLGFELESARVLGEEALLGEAIINLVINAIHYTPARGEVTVRCGALAARVFVEVEDNGPGIPPAARARVTERFYRIPGTPGTGSGLGLAIVQKIVTDHAGVMSILDANGPHGCLVRLTFPRASLA